MQQEVKHFDRVKTNLELIVTDLRLKLAGLVTDNDKLSEKIKRQHQLKKQFKEDIFDMLQNINDYKQLKKDIAETPLISDKKYVDVDDLGDVCNLLSSGNAGTHEESNRIRKHLEKSLDDVCDKLNKSKDTFNQQNKKIMTENVNLIREINQLKMALHNYTL